MAAVTFQPTAIAQDAVTENLAQQGAASQAKVNTNQTVAAPQDSVTLSQGIPPEPRIPILAPHFPVTPFPGFIKESGDGVGNNNAAGNDAQPAQVVPPTLPPNPPVNADAPQVPVVTVPALDPPGTGSAAINAGTVAAQAQLTPEQELAQLDQTLQQLGIDPQGISLFNRMTMLLFAQDPAALKNLVDALQAADQQLGRLTGLANSTGAQAQIQPPVQAAAPAAQNLAEQSPQAQPQAQNSAGGNNFEIAAAQFNFTEVQGTVTTESASANASGNGAAQAVQTTTQFQELQLSFTALEIQGVQAASPASNTGGNPNAQGQTLNVRA